MSSTEGSASASGRRAPAALPSPGAPARHPAPAALPSPGAPTRQPRSFKLRFAAQRVPGHSYQSAVRPLKLPALVTDKFWRRVGSEEAPSGAEAEVRALANVRGMVHKGPREKHDRPALSSHEYGWWQSAAGSMWAAPRWDRRLQHHLRDSEWLKVRLRVLAEAPPAARRR